MLAPNTFLHDRYLIVRSLDGLVYQALDTSGQATLALKQMPFADLASPAEREHIDRQGQALLGLCHPALAATADYFVEQGSAFLAAEFIEGQNLAQLMASQGHPFGVEQTLAWADRLLDALDQLHARQLLHRGIKPQGLILDSSGQLKLVDAGLSPLRPQLPLARPAGAAMGSSLQFMPPEQVQGAALTPRSDLYALAAALYYLLTGTLPALAGRRSNMRQRGQPDPLRPAHELNPAIPPVVSAALAAALALEAAQRPAGAAELRRLLRQGEPAATESQVPTLVAAPIVPTVAAPVAPAPRRRPTWLLPAIISAAGFILLFVVLALIVLRRMNPDAPPLVVQIATPAPASSVAAVPTLAPASTSVPTQDATGAATPTPAVAQISSIEPTELQISAQPVVLTLRGANLDQITQVRLVSDAGPPLEGALQPISGDQAALALVAGAQPLNGEFAYRLEVNGAPIEAPPIKVRDFIARRAAAGILAEYSYTNRVATDATGAYTAMRSEPDAASQPVGQLRPGDEVDILRDEVAGWYQLRIARSADQAQIGAVGWLERWLIDNQEAPAQPTAVPTPATVEFAGRVYSAPTDKAVQCGSTFDSSIYGSVEDTRGRGIAGARLRITSSDGRNTYNVTTGRGGVYNVPGLGCTTWVVRLLSVPGAPNGISANRVTVSNLNGGKFTAAEVRFKMR